MLIDQARICVKAGDGGNGCTSFYRDRFVRRGGPDGGDGGDGGNIIIKVDRNVHTLLDFQYKRHFKAEDGAHGSSNKKRGRCGRDLYIKVPPGTIIKDVETGLLLRDLIQDGEEVVVARCGKGGKGNSKKGSATPGDRGEEKELLLELKLIADVGIIGYPNVGKSTFISRISAAKSKVANYPFTTKTPILGIVKMYDTDLTFADMPGLIDGAHKGRGLGDEFLRHIERTSVLLHMVDIAQIEGRDAYEDYIHINRELSLYGHQLEKKPQVVVANKIDLPGAEKNFAVFQRKLDREAYPISAITGEGLQPLLDGVWRIVSNA